MDKMAYKENIKINSHLLLSNQLFIDLFESSFQFKKNPSNLIDNNDLLNYLLDEERPLIKDFENDFTKYFDKAKRNTNLNYIDKINHDNNIKTRLNFLYEITLIYPDYYFIPLIKLNLIDEPVFPEDYKCLFYLLEKYCSFDNNNINIYSPKNEILLELFDIVISIDDEDNDKVYTFEEIKILIRFIYYKYKDYIYLKIIKDKDDENYELKFKSGKNDEKIKFDIFGILWKILFKVNDDEIIKKIMDISLQILNNEMEIIYKINDQLDELDCQDEHDIKIIEKSYKLLKYFFIESEKNLSIKIKSHFSLLKDCIIKLPLEIENEENKLENEEIEFFYGNTSLNEVKELLVDKYDIYKDYIYAYIKQGDKNILLDYSYNHKSLNEILEEFNISNNKIINTFKKPMNSYLFFQSKGKKELIKDKDLSPDFKNVLEELLYKATRGKDYLEPRHFKKFIDPNIKKYFLTLKSNTPNKEYLTKEDIFKYYFEKINESKDEVLKELKKEGYNEDLKKGYDSKKREPIENDHLFRYYLSKVKEGQNFLEEFIFNYSNINPKIDYDLFFFIPTSEYYYGLFLNPDDGLYNEINNIFSNQNEIEILKQLYYLVIIESFLQDIELSYIDFKEVFNDQIFRRYKLSSNDYIPFDNRENTDKKIKFFDKFINEKNNYATLIEYATNLINCKKYEKDELSQKCLIKSLKIVKILYLSFIKTNTFKIKSEASKEKNIYFFNYLNIKEAFMDKIRNKNSNLSYSNLFLNIFNIFNEDNRNESLFEECLELIIILISSKENYFIEISNDNEKFKKFKNFIKEEIISSSSFIIEKILLSLNYISIKPSESLYIEFLYEIFSEIYSGILNRNIKKEINSDEYLELFTKFNIFIYHDKNFRKSEEIKSIIEILINDTNNSNEHIFSEDSFLKYISIFNNYFLKVASIRNLIFSYRTSSKTKKDLSLISSFFNHIKELTHDNEIQKSTKKDNEKMILLEENTTKKSIYQRNLLNKTSQFIRNCLVGSKIDIYSIKEISNIYEELLKLNYPKKEKVFLYNDEVKTKNAGFVGLKNLSSTCYMNAVLQQLFMIHVIKYAIIGINDISQDNDILIQMQLLFANLKLSQKKIYNTTNLCMTKIFNNRPINVQVQQDSKEFYDSVCDSLEACLKNSKYKYIINDALMGCMSHSIKCESCGYTSNKFENFCDLSLEVKDITTLKKSLKHLIQEEKVPDYFCDNCNTKVTIQKRITLSKLPNTLFLHLKRFTFEKGINQKILSGFKFYLKLNLQNYCTEIYQNETDDIYYKNDDYYLYELKGVVQHSGNANGGHYISFIDVNREGIGNIMNQYKEKEKRHWIEFNDSKVSEFDMKSGLPKTFGNNESTNTAYLLIYERIKKSPIRVVIKNFNKEDQTIINFKEEEMNKINKIYDIYNKNSTIKEEDLYKLIFYNETKNEYFKYIPYYSIRKEIPRNIYDEIMKENQLMGIEANDNSNSSIIMENFINDIEDNLFSTIDSKHSLNEIQLANVNDKYDFIKIIILLLFKKLDDKYLNLKLDAVKNFISQTLLSKENFDFIKLLELSKLLITNEKLEIIFIGDKSYLKQVFDKNNIEFFQTLIIVIISNICSINDDKYIKEKGKEIERIAKVLTNYYLKLEAQKSQDKLFNDSLLDIIQKNRKLLGDLLENNFINIVLNNFRNDREEKIFKIVKAIIKSTKDYYNKDLFFHDENDEENKKIKDRPALKKEQKNQLRKRILDNKSELMQILFRFDQELLIILSKILCYSEVAKDQYSLKFILEYYKACKVYLQEEKYIVNYFSVYFDLIDIKDEGALIKMRILLGYPRIIIIPENSMYSDNYINKNYFYENVEMENYLKEKMNLRLGEEIDKEILENELNMNYIGEQLIKINNGDIQTHIYDYNNTHIIDERIIGFLTEIFSPESKLEKFKNELIYRLIDKCFNGCGNYNIFKYLYTLPARSLYYGNIFEELMAQLDKIYQKKLEYINPIKEYFIARIKGNPLPNIPKKYIEYNPDIKSILQYQGFIPEYIPGKVFKKSIQIVKENKFIELIRLEYFTQFNSIENIKNIYNNANAIPEQEINNENIKVLIGIGNEEKNEELDLKIFSYYEQKGLENYDKIDEDILKRFKKGEKIIIRFDEDNKNKNKQDIKTIISYIIVNKKPFINKYALNIKFRQNCQEMKDNSCVVNNKINNFILERSYKVITNIQRKSLNSKFFESVEIFAEITTSYVSEKEFIELFYPLD